MNTENLQTFLLLSNLKSFTLTAEKLFVVQSTITNRIAELERETGRKLFIRGKKHVELTGEGILFKNYAKRILELEESAIQEMNQGNFYKTILRIGCANTIYESHLYPIFHTFLNSNKDTSLKVILNHSEDLLDMLEDQLLDAVFSYVFYKKSGYQCIPFATDELVLVTSFKNSNFVEGIYKEDLLKINYLMCDLALQEIGQSIRSLFPPYYQFHFEIDNSTKLVQYLLDGIGYSFMPKNMVEPYIKNGSLLLMPLLDFDAPSINSYFIYRTNTEQMQKLLPLLHKKLK